MKNPGPGRPHYVRRQVRIWATGISLGSLGIGFLLGGWQNLAQAGDGSSRPLSTGAILIVNGALVLGAYWFMELVIWPIRALSQQLNAATIPVLSPAQIAAHLEHDLGRPPTADEVAVTHLIHFSQCTVGASG